MKSSSEVVNLDFSKKILSAPQKPKTNPLLEQISKPEENRETYVLTRVSADDLFTLNVDEFKKAYKQTCVKDHSKKKRDEMINKKRMALNPNFEKYKSFKIYNLNKPANESLLVHNGKPMIAK